MQREPEIKIGDLVVHIGAKPSGYRVRLVCDISLPVLGGKYIFFADGRKDFESSWRVFNGWDNNERR